MTTTTERAALRSALNEPEIIAKWKKHSAAWYATHPSPLSNPKEIVGHHGHRPHGPSVRWPALYEHLKAKGMTKRKAAMISNGLWNKKHGVPTKNPSIHTPAATVHRVTKDMPTAGDVHVNAPMGSEGQRRQTRASKRKALRRIAQMVITN